MANCMSAEDALKWTKANEKTRKQLVKGAKKTANTLAKAKKAKEKLLKKKVRSTGRPPSLHLRADGPPYPNRRCLTLSGCM